MVCEKCEKKLSKGIVPDKWKDGARNTVSGGGRPVGHKNSLLAGKGKNARFTPYDRKCRICKSKVSQNAHYCQGCAYQKGICAMCGKKVTDTKMLRMSAK